MNTIAYVAVAIVAFWLICFALARTQDYYEHPVRDPTRFFIAAVASMLWPAMLVVVLCAVGLWLLAKSAENASDLLDEFLAKRTAGRRES